jgi:hypothetical protein
MDPIRQIVWAAQSALMLALIATVTAIAVALR